MRRSRLQPKHVSFQGMLQMFAVHACHRYDSKAFHTRGQAAEKFMSPKPLCVRGMTHIL